MALGSYKNQSMLYYSTLEKLIKQINRISDTIKIQNLIISLTNQEL